MALFIFYISVVFLLTSSSNGEVSLEEIYKRAKEALVSNHTGCAEQVLMKYYFTNKRDDSVWWHAHKKTVQLFDLTLAKEAVERIEVSIQKIFRRYLLCKNLVERSIECFEKFAEILENHRRDFLWKLTGIGARKGMSENGAYYVSYVAMSILVSDVSLAKIVKTKSVEDFEESKSIVKEFFSVIAKSKDFLFDYKSRVSQWRVDQINAVVICEVSLLFWKEYPGVCETRWRRNLDDVTKATSGQLSQRKSWHAGIVNTTETEVYKKSDFQYPELDVVDYLGGKTNAFHKVFRAKVFDKTSKSIYFNEKITIKENERRGEALQRLFQRGIKKRFQVETGIRKGIQKFVDETWGIVEEMIEIFYDQYH